VQPADCAVLWPATILPVVKEQHQLLVTLLLCNAAAMEVDYLLIYFSSVHAFTHPSHCSNVLSFFSLFPEKTNSAIVQNHWILLSIRFCGFDSGSTNLLGYYVQWGGGCNPVSHICTCLWGGKKLYILSFCP
jgi:hypothetical protein